MAERQLVFLRDSASLQQIPEAADLLTAQGMTLVRSLAEGDAAHVVALVTGLGRVSLADVEAFANLRVVAQFGAGTDNIDVAGLWHARKIPVTCTANLSNRHVAEQALAMLILTLRHVPQDISGLRADPFRWRDIQRGKGLSESVVGIVGAGNIGLEVARIVAPLAARVLVWSQRGRTLDLPPGCETVSSLDDLATSADAVTVHLSLNEATRGIIGAEFFAKSHHIALVNTSRGSIVDEAALLAALEAGSVRAAAVDVWSSEGVKDNPLIRALRLHPSVLPTSHIGAFTTGVQQLYAVQVARNILAVMGGRLAEISEHLATPAAL